jgi:sugar (pentulose or hexulose) kinase
MTHVAGIALSGTAATAQVHELGSGRLVASHVVPIAAGSVLADGEVDTAAGLAAVMEVIDGVSTRGAAALAISSPLHGLVVVDAGGQSVRPALTAIDGRSGPDAGWCRKKFSTEWWAEQLGVVPASFHTVTKLSWLHRSEADHWARTAGFLTLHDYVASALAASPSRRCTDPASASGTGYWSSVSAAYHADVLSLIDASRNWSAALPDVVPAGSRLGMLGPTAVAVGTSHVAAVAEALAVETGDVVVLLDEPVRVVALATSATTVVPVDDVSDIWVDRLVDVRGRPMLSLVLPGRPADVVTPDRVREVLEVLERAGASTHGAMTVVSDRSDVSVVAPWLAKVLGRRVLRCGAADAIAMGAAACAAFLLEGSWPDWSAPASQR